MIVVLLEAVRRRIGIIVPIIILLFTAYAIFGQSIPIQIMKHPGLSWSLFVNNMYFPDLGIYGVTLWIVSTVVFHFVLFGVLAQRIGLGQFFVDLATVAAGSVYRRAGKGFGGVFSFVWHNLGIVNCQYRFDWFVDHSKYEEKAVIPDILQVAWKLLRVLVGKLRRPSWVPRHLYWLNFLKFSYTTVVIAAACLLQCTTLG